MRRWFNALDHLIVGRGRQHEITGSHEDWRSAGRHDPAFAFQDREIDWLALNIASDAPPAGIFDEL
jgi:hypothetical protein